ncbi:MAG: FixH family protein [Zoogloeaceae bacterium]|jgi:hypothetical protein|nr:FixH family protein [Zoogloeaceae bacterium]
MNETQTENMQQQRPWYREPWPWFLIAGPGIVVIAGFVTLWLAVRTFDGVVVDDYYKQGLAVNQVIDRDLAARGMGLQANIMKSGMDVRVFLTATEMTALPDQLLLRVTHPTRSGMDQDIPLVRDAQGFYSGRLTAEISGRRHVFLEDQALTWRLTGNWQASSEMPLQLSPHQ